MLSGEERERRVVVEERGIERRSMESGNGLASGSGRADVGWIESGSGNDEAASWTLSASGSVILSDFDDDENPSLSPSIATSIAPASDSSLQIVDAATSSSPSPSRTPPFPHFSPLYPARDSHSPYSQTSANHSTTSSLPPAVPSSSTQPPSTQRSIRRELVLVPDVRTAHSDRIPPTSKTDPLQK